MLEDDFSVLNNFFPDWNNSKITFNSIVLCHCNCLCIIFGGFNSFLALTVLRISQCYMSVRVRVCVCVHL